MNKLHFLVTTLIVITFMVGCITMDNDEVVLDRSEFDWQLVWSDEFESDQIDENKWNFIIGAGGYGNNELQYYSDREENARIEKGNLIIEAHEESFEDSSYTSAKMTTQGKGDWTYGHYEIRAKLPKGQGIWPAFWMMPTDYNIYGSWPSCGEIDIMEVLGHEPNKTHGTLHYGNPHKYTGDSFTLEKGTFSNSFHTFAIDWLPGEIRWYIDGVLFQVQNSWYSKSEYKGGDITFPAPFDRDFYMQFNLAVGGNWPGVPDNKTKFPQKLIIDWIRVYESANGYSNVVTNNSKEEMVSEKSHEPLKDGNLIYNGSFDRGSDRTEFWKLDIDNESDAKLVVNPEIYKREGSVITLSSSGVENGITLYQDSIDIYADEEYELSFEAYAKAPREIAIALQNSDGSNIYESKVLELTSTKKRFTETIQVNESINNIRVAFLISKGEFTEDVILDNVSFIKLKKPVVVNELTKIEAEDFFNKSSSPQTQNCGEGTLNVGWMGDGDWLNYRLNVTTQGRYIIRYRIASEKSDIPIMVESSLGSDKHIFEGSEHWQNWVTIEGEIELPKGETILTLSATDININWIELVLIN